ncbi:MAG TPA: hypothetical protein VL122_00440 [Nitrospirota bacterium]|nr:hypothetical protein [Nitrospirota bacterium]
MQVGKLLRRLIGDDIELKMDLEGCGLIILVDFGQIEQVYPLFSKCHLDSPCVIAYTDFVRQRQASYCSIVEIIVGSGMFKYER